MAVFILFLSSDNTDISYDHQMSLSCCFAQSYNFVRFSSTALCLLGTLIAVDPNKNKKQVTSSNAAVLSSNDSFGKSFSYVCGVPGFCIS